MAEKIIQTRIINKNSALTEWLNGNFNLADGVEGVERLKKGEIALAYVETVRPSSNGELKTVPIYLMKVGDGISSFSDLEWLSAPASDVYSWAKASELIFENGILIFKNGAEDGTDLQLNFKSIFYSQEEVEALLAGKADIQHGTHVTWATNSPKMNGNVTVGTSNKVAREDHVHPVDTSRASVDHRHTVADLDLPATMPPSEHDHNADYYTKAQIDATVSSLNSAIDTKATSDHNHDNIYTKPTEVDNKIAVSLVSTFRYKGIKTTTAGLPTSSSSVGDVWTISSACIESGSLPKVSAGDCVFWNGTVWEVFTSSPDLSNFYSQEEVDALLASKAAISHGTHVIWETGVPKMNNAASAGTSNTVARGDHVHPVDTSRAPLKHTHELADLPATMPPSEHNHDADYYTKDEIDAKAATLSLTIDTKADETHNHDSIYAKPADIDTKISAALGSAMKYKGTKATTAQLPTSGNSIGDVWNISNACEASGSLPKVNAGDSVAWNGTSWDVISGTVDLSNFYDKSEVEALLAGKANTSHGTHVIWTTTTPKVNGVASIGTENTVARGDHVHPVDTSRAAAKHTHTAADLPETMPPSAHDHDDAYYTKTEADSLFTNKEVFNKIKVGNSTVNPQSTEDTLELVAGSNVILTPDDTNNKITVSAKDTHCVTNVYVGSVGSSSHEVTTNPYINIFDDNTARNTVQFVGDETIEVSSDDSGTINLKAFADEYIYEFDGGLATDCY